MRVIIRTDASLVNGRWQAGWTFTFGDKRKYSETMSGSQDIGWVAASHNNLAELHAVHAGVSAFIELSRVYVRARKAKIMRVFSDNASAVDLLSGKGLAKNPDYAAIVAAIHDLLRYRFDELNFRWVPRAANSAADKASRRFAMKGESNA